MVTKPPMPVEPLEDSEPPKLLPLVKPAAPKEPPLVEVPPVVTVPLKPPRIVTAEPPVFAARPPPAVPPVEPPSEVLLDVSGGSPRESPQDGVALTKTKQNNKTLSKFIT
ncbi:MAG TPA: hypothetical protein VKP30_00530 [Polyangiaceae bacterium]|nr:hypothetical protein [Polyangiaceae bacterium]